MFNEFPPWSQGGTFLRLFFHISVQTCCCLFRGIGPRICKLPKNQSDVNEVSDEGDEGGLCFRTARLPNLLHSVLLSFAKMVLTSLPPKAPLFLFCFLPLLSPGSTYLVSQEWKTTLKKCVWESLASIWVGRVFETLFLLHCEMKQGKIAFNVQTEELDNILKYNCVSYVSTVEMACFH